jgi:hypothetical protein
LAGLPKDLIENPNDLKAHAPAGRDVLSDVLRAFSRAYGAPPAAWQQRARAGQAS